MNKPNKGLAALPNPDAKALDAFVAGHTPPHAQNPAEAPKGVSLDVTPIEAEEPTQRLTLEIPLSLHILIKTGCVQRRTKMKDEVLKLLESHYRPQG